MRIFKSDAEYNFHNPPTGLRAVARVLQDQAILPASLISESGLYFSAFCPCGSETFFVREENGIVYIVCSVCGYTFIVYDPKKHGIHPKETETGSQQNEVELICSNCSEKMMAVYLCYYYSSKVNDTERKQEDLFDTFVLFGICASCSYPAILLTK